MEIIIFVGGSGSVFLGSLYTLVLLGRMRRSYLRWKAHLAYRLEHIESALHLFTCIGDTDTIDTILVKALDSIASARFVGAATHALFALYDATWFAQKGAVPLSTILTIQRNVTVTLDWLWVLVQRHYDFVQISGPVHGQSAALNAHIRVLQRLTYTTIQTHHYLAEQVLQGDPTSHTLLAESIDNFVEVIFDLIALLELTEG